MTGPIPTPVSSTHPHAADTTCCEGGSCAPGPSTRPILEWDNAWSNGSGGYEAPEHALLEARAMFQRILAPWAMDVLRLKAAGLDRPAHPDRTLPAFDALPLRPAAAPRRRAA